MARRFDITRLQAISKLPGTGGAEWLVTAEDSVEFLKANAQSDEVVIYASGPATLIHAVFAPVQQVTPANQEDLLHCFVQTDESWVIQKSYGGGEGHRVYLEAPLSSRCKSLAGGEKLIFRRSFDGVQKGESTIELSQKLVHALGLHFVPERNAYCRLDQRGDIEDVIRIIRLDEGAGREAVTAVTILTKDLSTYMTLADMALVFIFDFTRFRPGSFNGWGCSPSNRTSSTGPLLQRRQQWQRQLRERAHGRSLHRVARTIDRRVERGIESDKARVRNVQDIRPQEQDRSGHLLRPRIPVQLLPRIGAAMGVLTMAYPPPSSRFPRKIPGRVATWPRLTQRL